MTWLIRTAVAGPIDCGTRPKQVGCRPQFILNVLLPEIQIDLFTKKKETVISKVWRKAKAEARQTMVVCLKLWSR